MTISMNTSTLNAAATFSQFYKPSDPREIAKRANKNIANVQDTVQIQRMNKAVSQLNTLIASNFIEILSKNMNEETVSDHRALDFNAQQVYRAQQQNLSSTLYLKQSPGLFLEIRA